MSSSGDFFEDVGCRGGPDERFGVSIVLLEINFDRGLEFGHAVEHAAADGVFSDQAEEALDEIDPGGGSRREMEVGGGGA